jgi:hypothetical protein
MVQLGLLRGGVILSLGYHSTRIRGLNVICLKVTEDISRFLCVLVACEFGRQVCGTICVH